MLALDLFGAIMAAGLSTYAQIVLAEVLAQWAGPQKKTRVYLHGTEFNELTGIDRNSARKAIAELVSAKILVADGQGYRFNKDYDSWTPKLGRLEDRIGGRIHGWAVGLIERLGFKTHKKTREATQPHQTVVGEATQPQKSAPAEATQPHGKPSGEATQPQRHIEEPARQKNSELRSENGEGEFPLAPRSIPMDPISKECLQLATERWGASNGDAIIGDLLRTFPPKVVRFAMDREWDKHGAAIRASYIRTICREVDAEGIPKKPGEDRGKTAVQQRPQDTVAPLKRPDMPRTPEFAAIHQMWDDMESEHRRNGVAS